MDLKKIATMIYDIGGVKFGDFTHKGNVQTPVYFDFRNLISYPRLLVSIYQKKIYLIYFLYFIRLLEIIRSTRS